MLEGGLALTQAELRSDIFESVYSDVGVLRDAGALTHTGRWVVLSKQLTRQVYSDAAGPVSAGHTRRSFSPPPRRPQHVQPGPANPIRQRRCCACFPTLSVKSKAFWGGIACFLLKQLPNVAYDGWKWMGGSRGIRMAAEDVRTGGEAVGVFSDASIWAYKRMYAPYGPSPPIMSSPSPSPSPAPSPSHAPSPSPSTSTTPSPLPLALTLALVHPLALANALGYRAVAKPATSGAFSCQPAAHQRAAYEGSSHPAAAYAVGC